MSVFDWLGKLFAWGPKPVCCHGHEISGNNVLVKKNGKRHCKACQYEYIRKYKERKAQGLVRVCKHGHLQAGHNVIVRKNGTKACRACHQQAMRRYLQRRKAGLIKVA